MVEQLYRGKKLCLFFYFDKRHLNLCNLPYDSELLSTKFILLEK
jgi:hypothetical protein